MIEMLPKRIRRRAVLVALGIQWRVALLLDQLVLRNDQLYRDWASSIGDAYCDSGPWFSDAGGDAHETTTAASSRAGAKVIVPIIKPGDTGTALDELLREHEVHRIATRVLGCTRCGKPAALVGDRIPENGLCPWCDLADRMLVARAYRAEFIAIYTGMERARTRSAIAKHMRTTQGDWGDTVNDIERGTYPGADSPLPSEPSG